ncbi:hypothetical protein BC941DRAFT_440096 [Chlamydoabsidia padenii]|nr:hypothetical protein BC941DRAFT_440096 [Chlamydoabsidia padenii]
MKDCIICFDSLSTQPVAALCCGHVFHHPCISSWVATKALCPLCKKRIPNSQLPIRPLFLDLTPSSDDIETITADTSMDSASQHDHLKGLLSTLKQQLETAQKETRQQALRFEREKADYVYQIKQYKNIKQVINMKERLSIVELQRTIQEWHDLPREELCLRSVVLLEQHQETATKNEELELLLERAYKRIDTLKEKVRKPYQDSNMATSSKRKRISLDDPSAHDTDLASSSQTEESSTLTQARTGLLVSASNHVTALVRKPLLPSTQINLCDDDDDDRPNTRGRFLDMLFGRSPRPAEPVFIDLSDDDEDNA